MLRMTAEEIASEYPGAERYMPESTSLSAMREAVQACRGCPL